MKPQWYAATKEQHIRGRLSVIFRITALRPRGRDNWTVVSGPLSHPEAHRLVRQWQGLDGPPVL